MAKNKQLAEFYKVMQAKIADTLPRMYSAVAIALWHQLDMPDEEKVEAIESVFAETQEIWQKCADGMINIMEECKELTGIEIMR